MFYVTDTDIPFFHITDTDTDVPRTFMTFEFCEPHWVLLGATGWRYWVALLGGTYGWVLDGVTGLYCHCLALAVLRIVSFNDCLDRRREALVLLDEHNTGSRCSGIFSGVGL